MWKHPTSSGLWQGVTPPQYIFANRRFKRVVLDPPDFDPGSWVGAGKAVFNHQTAEFLLTARPRKAGGKARGFAARIYRSRDGERFELLTSLGKEEISEKSGLTIHSIEGTQLLKDPLSGKWHLYLSVDTGSEFVWGGLHWETLLLTGSHLQGPWEVEGLVLRNDQEYDANQARDATIDIVDGMWLCLYRARDADRGLRPAFATSSDGISWKKRGVLTTEGLDRPVFLSGTIFAGTSGPLFIGLERLEDNRSQREEVFADEYRVGHGSGPVRNFVGYNLDYRNMNLELVFRAPWEPRSKYEHKEQSLLGYGSLVYDPLRNRMLTYVEAIDGQFTKKMGLNQTVERLLLYETLL